MSSPLQDGASAFLFGLYAAHVAQHSSSDFTKFSLPHTMASPQKLQGNKQENVSAISHTEDYSNTQVVDRVSHTVEPMCDTSKESDGKIIERHIKLSLLTLCASEL